MVYIAYVQRKNVQDVEKLSEEFEGNLPKINITCHEDFAFLYTCKHTGRPLYSPCDQNVPLSNKCFDCIGMNTKFTKFYKDNCHCSCNYIVDFGYFMIIFLFGEAGLLTDDFRMMCCACYEIDKKPTCRGCNIDG